MLKNNYPCTVKYHDLKSDIYVFVSFDHPNDCIEFFSKYNPCSVDIEECSIVYDRALDNDYA